MVVLVKGGRAKLLCQLELSHKEKLSVDAVEATWTGGRRRLCLLRRPLRDEVLNGRDHLPLANVLHQLGNYLTVGG